ncbi:hypothetical protein ACEN9X_09445 [Mucilaginibacter sp. Mucisp86]|uniref:hypothetical protein n=1 Tax=Mucilaginibacter sp. Mucisp86 TaxID=3243060 RepID=UPI0039B44B9D
MLLEQLNISNAATISLAEWQRLLVAHFTFLAKSRKEKNRSVFALEHGLRPSQVKIITTRLIDDHRLNAINKSYWLLWVVYSTELGYEYVGDEYWQSFEEKLRYWDSSHRESIRWAFKEFQKQFNGITPCGTWANNFSIISWPITNAILPEDLQYQFAKLLFLCRYTLKNVSHQNASYIGKLLGKFAYEFSSSRFLNFLQNEELVGRIALALLAHNNDVQSEDFIYNITLKRIIADIEKKQNARDLMHGARREIKPRILGAANHDKSKNNVEGVNRSINTTRNPSIKPKLALQRVSENKWAVTIEIPRLADIIDTPLIIELLKKSRVKIAGVNSNWLPADILLGASLKRKLSEWPLEKPLLYFEDKESSLFDLTNNISISNAPWLFQLGTDGQVVEVVNKNIEVAHEYLILTYNDQWPESKLLFDSNIDCKGIYARHIKIPEMLAEADEKLLISLGLNIQKSIRIWPAGLPAYFWDGNGSGEWLATESPCLGIVVDYDFEKLKVSLGQANTYFPGKTSGNPTFIRLNPLPVGSHTLKINLYSAGSIKENVECYVNLEIRNPETWVRGTTMHNGLAFQIDPYSDDLDELLGGKIQVKVFGPQNRSIILNLDFFMGKEIVKTISSKPIPFPFNQGELKKVCEQAIKDDAVIYSQKLRLRIYCEDLGHKDLIFTRKIPPLRWFFKSVDRSPCLKLVDETDSDQSLKVLFFDLSEPEIEKDISTETFSQLVSLKSRCGLFLARRGEHQTSIVISHTDRVHGFDALSIAPKLNENRDLHIPGYLSFIKTWITARSSGILSQIHQEKVVEASTIKLFSHLCGTRWANGEKEFIDGSNIIRSIENLARIVENPTIQNTIKNKLLDMQYREVDISEISFWLNRLFKRYNICASDPLISFAMDFASRPLSFAGNYDQKFSSMINHLIANKSILRSCRLVVLSTAKYIDPNRNYPLLLPSGWQ